MMTPLFVLTISLCSIAGLVIFATYAECDPLTKGWILHDDEVMMKCVDEQFKIRFLDIRVHSPN